MEPSGQVRYRATILTVILGYYLYFTWDRIHVHFAADDMMNMGFYFPLSLERILRCQVFLWEYLYRPLGAAYYLPLLHYFGLNPFPYQVTCLILIAVNALLLFRFAKVLGCTDTVAGVATLFLAYHVGLGNLLYSIDMIYDVLCFLFYIGALAFYVGVRRSGRMLRWPEALFFFLLYLCALNSKEMALTMPLVILAYEWFYHPPKCRQFRPLIAWLGGACRIALPAIALNLVYLYGKIFGNDAILNYPAYQPVFTFERLLDFQKAALYDILALYSQIGWQKVLIVWVLVTYLAWRRDRPVLRFCWSYILLTPLPIEFLQGRVHGCLYIPMAGWVIFASVVLLDAIEAASSRLAGFQFFRALGRERICAAFLVGVLVMWTHHTAWVKRRVISPPAAEMGALTWNVIQQMRALNPRVKPTESRII